MKKIIFILVGLTVFILLISSEFAIRSINGNSMEPNFPNHSNIFLHKFLVSSPDPLRGQVVIYKHNNSDVPTIGRVVGMPGESVMIKNGSLYFDNGKQYQLTEKYLPKDTKTGSFQDNTWIKIESPNQYLVLPDNRSRAINFQEQLINRYSIIEIQI